MSLLSPVSKYPTRLGLWGTTLTATSPTTTTGWEGARAPTAGQRYEYSYGGEKDSFPFAVTKVWVFGGEAGAAVRAQWSRDPIQSAGLSLLPGRKELSPDLGESAAMPGRTENPAGGAAPPDGTGFGARDHVNDWEFRLYCVVSINSWPISRLANPPFTVFKYSPGKCEYTEGKLSLFHRILQE